MQITRHADTSGSSASWQERDALARAEFLCDQAEILHQDAVAQAEEVLAAARADAARLLREALAVVDENLARSEAARRQQEMNRLAAEAARREAEQLLASVRIETARIPPTVVATATDGLACDAKLIDLRELDRIPR
jgi:cell division septum initiation protein DivIVA